MVIAEQTLAEALRRFPDEPSLNGRYGTLLLWQKRFSEALPYLERSVQEGITILNSSNAGNLALVYSKLGRFEEAISMADKALAVCPVLICAKAAKAVSKLTLGDWSPEYLSEAWLDTERIINQRANDVRWKGDYIPGKTLSVFAEHGDGDTIFGLRNLSLIKSKSGAKIILELRPSMIELARATKLPFDEIRELKVPPRRDYDQSVGLMEAIGVLGVNLGNVTDEPYLRLESAKADSLPVAYCYHGNPVHSNDFRRSMSTSDRDYLLQVFPGAVSLQEEDLNFDRSGPTAKPSWLETAFYLSRFRLIVTVDTAVAHLAGAMGKQLCLMLPKVPEWRWGLGASKTSWYDSVTIYRQQTEGDWKEVIDRICQTQSR